MRKIGKIISAGAGTSMTDKEFLEQEIARWKRSAMRKQSFLGERYYHSRHDILKRKRTAIGKDGALVEVKNLPNNRKIDNQYAKMVDQKVNYLVGKPLTFESENKDYTETLKKVFSGKFQRMFRNASEASLNGAIAWIYPFYAKDGSLQFTFFKSHEILPFWADSEHTKLDLAVRIYQTEVYEGFSRRIIERVEVYRPEGVEYYELDQGELVPDSYRNKKDYIVFENNEGGSDSYNWGKVPLIPLRYNSQEIPLIQRLKGLQDGINAIISDFQNNMQEDYRNTILVIENAEGTDLGEFRQNLTQFGVVKVRSTSDAKGGVTALEVKVNSENYKAILEIFKRALISNAMGYDATDLRTTGSPNQMNIKSVLNDIDLDANRMETEYQAAFEELLEFVKVYLYNADLGDFTHDSVEVIFNRDTIISESEVIQDIKNSVGILSDETLVAQHPYVKNVESELEKLEKQRGEDERDLEYQDAFQPRLESGGMNGERGVLEKKG